MRQHGARPVLTAGLSTVVVLAILSMGLVGVAAAEPDAAASSADRLRASPQAQALSEHLGLPIEELPASGSPSDPWAADADANGEAAPDGSATFSTSVTSGTTASTTSSSGPVKLPPTAPILAKGGGWGHGVGMSQYGAQAMALAGRSHTQILTHYHQGTAVQTRTMPTNFRVGLLARPWNSANQAQSVHFDRMTVVAVDGPISWRVCASVTGSCSSVVRQQPAGTTYVAGNADGRMILRHSNGTVYVDDASAQFLRAELSTGATPRRVRLAEKSSRTYRWGALEVRQPRPGSTGVRATINFGAHFEKYVMGIAEVPFSWHTQALRAQAVAARSYANARSMSLRAICHCILTDGPENQVYYGADRELGAGGTNWITAVDATAGRVLTHNNAPIATFYSSSHNKRSENVEDVWSFPQPYHRSVSDPWSSASSANNPYASWTAAISNSSLASRVGGMARVTYVRVLERTKGGTPRRIEVHGLTSSGNRVTRTYTGTKTAGAALYSAYGLRSAQIDVLTPSPFTDTQAWALRSHVYDIAQFARAGLTNGCNSAGTRYCPERSVSRGEMSAFLHRTAGEPRPPRRHSFPDVSRSAYYDDAVSWLVAEGITTGWGDTGQYRPNNSVTRAQMVTFLWRMAGEPRPSSRHSFPDVSRNAYYDQAVSWALQRGITVGWGSTGRFEPDRNVSRAQMATFIIRYITVMH